MSSGIPKSRQTSNRSSFWSTVTTISRKQARWYLWRLAEALPQGNFGQKSERKHGVNRPYGTKLVDFFGTIAEGGSEFFARLYSYNISDVISRESIAIDVDIVCSIYGSIAVFLANNTKVMGIHSKAWKAVADLKKLEGFEIRMIYKNFVFYSLSIVTTKSG